jgi:succinyl-diaminopimelate desuccinylase
VPIDPTDKLLKIIDERRDELVELTRALIRFRTVNPPGDSYAPCAEFIGNRLRAHGFTVDYVADGARRDGRRPQVGIVFRN